MTPFTMEQSVKRSATKLRNQILIVLLLFVSLVSISHAGDFDVSVSKILTSAKQDCGSSFILKDNAVTQTDLNSDGITDIVTVDEGGFKCLDTEGSAYCGSGGCRVHFITEVDKLSGFARDWEILQTRHGKKIILLLLHGSACGEIGVVDCFKVISVTNGRFIYQD